MNVVQLLTTLGAAVVLVGLGEKVWQKEQLRNDGKRVLLELAPVDPRSLLQGDYMALRFSIADEQERRLRESKSKERKGFIPISFDVHSVAQYENGGPARLGYKLRHDRVWIGTNGFFFEEGAATRYESARYGVFKLNMQTGEAMLVALADADRQEIRDQ